MISTDEFKARLEAKDERRSALREETLQLRRELKAHCALAGLDVDETFKDSGNFRVTLPDGRDILVTDVDLKELVGSPMPHEYAEQRVGDVTAP